MNILSIDFDYFFPMKDDLKQGGVDWMLYDWGHDERHPEPLLDFLWVVRAEQFLRVKHELPKCTEEVNGFWERFNFSPTTQLYLMDSHKEAVAGLEFLDIESIWNFDAHHDCGYSISQRHRLIEEQTVDCGSWLAAYRLYTTAKIHVRHPSWADDDVMQDDIAFEPDTWQHYKPGEELPVFDIIYFARSPHWTPSWVDDTYWELAESAPVCHTEQLSTMVRRSLDMDAVRKEMEARSELQIKVEGEFCLDDNVKEEA